MTTSLPPILQSRLRAVARRLRACVLLEGLGRLCMFLVIAAAIQFALDYGARGLQWSMRAVLLAAILAGTVWVVWRMILSPFRVGVGLPEIANLVERRFPELGSILISAVRFASGSAGRLETNSPELMAAVVSRAANEVAPLNFQRVINSRRARRGAFAVLGSIAVCAAAALGLPELTSYWFARNVLLQEVAWPRRTTLIVAAKNGEIVGAIGDDLVIEATAQGVQPKTVDLYYETASGTRGRDTMSTVGSAGSFRYRYTVHNAQEDFVFYLKGGDDRTAAYKARLIERPRVVETGVRIIPPAYTRREAMVLGDGQRTAELLLGSQVMISITTNKPVVRASLMAGRERLAEAQADYQGATPESTESPAGRARAAQRFTATITPAATQTYHFALLDEYDLDDRQPLRIALRVSRDEPPRARLKVDGAGSMITADAVLPIEVEFADTYGLAAAEIIARSSREGSETVAIVLPEFVPHSLTLTTSLNWAVSQAAVQPGDRLTLGARAADFDDISGPNLGQSPEVTFRVVTRDELLAELAQREQEYRADFERLIDAQEQIRGKLLTELNQVQRGETQADIAGSLTALERRQRNISSSVNGIRQQFEQILVEMRVNQLASAATEERLGGEIVNPLAELVKRELAVTADNIRHWSRAPSAETGLQVDRQQAELITKLRAVLANMLQWEGYQETVSMLRDILKLQGELKDETRRTLEEQGSEVFDK